MILSPLSRQSKKPKNIPWLLHYTWRGFFMARKGQQFQHYSKELITFNSIITIDSRKN
ncbi:hypothetical protein BACI9J_130133 [Bacillus altitudinis]|nr:hypothetical protein BACI9J_130133 [Bacillus altitudinis]